MKHIYICTLSLVSLFFSCKEERPKKIIESRSAFKEVVFEEFENRNATCNAEQGYITFDNLDGMKISGGLTKTAEGYKLLKGKICDLTLTDCHLRVRLERIENGAYMLYYEYIRESEDPTSDKIIRDIDKGKVVFTCNK